MVHPRPGPCLRHILPATVGPCRGPALEGALASAALRVGAESEATLGLRLCASTQTTASPDFLGGFSWTLQVLCVLIPRRAKAVCVLGLTKAGPQELCSFHALYQLPQCCLQEPWAPVIVSCPVLPQPSGPGNHRDRTSPILSSEESAPIRSLPLCYMSFFFVRVIFFFF